MTRRERAAAKRERRMLIAALREAPPPQPPDGLLEQILDRVPTQSAPPVRRRAWHPAWVAGGALAALAAWPASCQLATSLPGSEPTAATQETAAVAKQPTIATSQSSMGMATAGQPKGAEESVAPAENQADFRRPRRERHDQPQVLLAAHPVGDDQVTMSAPQPVMAVSVGRSEEASASVAKAAAWRQDENGRWVRTVWELSKGKETMKVVGADGHVQKLIVVPAKTESNGDKP